MSRSAYARQPCKVSRVWPARSTWRLGDDPAVTLALRARLITMRMVDWSHGLRAAATTCATLGATATEAAIKVRAAGRSLAAAVNRLQESAEVDVYRSPRDTLHVGLWRTCGKGEGGGVLRCGKESTMERPAVYIGPQRAGEWTGQRGGMCGSCIRSVRRAVRGA